MSGYIAFSTNLAYLRWNKQVLHMLTKADTERIQAIFNTLGILLASLIIVWSPFSGGARLPTLLLSLLGLGYLLVLRSYAWHQLEVKRWSLVFLLLWLPMWLSLINSVQPKATTITIAWFTLLYLAGISLTQVLKHPTYRNFLAHIVLWTTVIWFADSLLQYFTGSDILGIPRRDDGRITGPFKDLHQGIILLPVLPLTCYLLIQQRRLWGAIVVLLMGAWMMAMSGSRGYLYILLLILGGMIFQLRLDVKKALFFLAVPLIAVFAAYQMSHPLITMKMGQTEQLTQPSMSSFDRFNGLLSHRLHLWETGMHMFLSHPFTGIGSSNFKTAYPEYATRPDDPFIKAPTHTHNIYIELLAETGIAGFSALIAIMGLFYRWYRGATEVERAQAWPFALPLMAIYFPINTTQPMLVPWWFPLLMLLACGFIASLGPIAPKEKTE